MQKKKILSANPGVMFSSQLMSKSVCKDSLLIPQTSLVIYSFKCQHNTEYTGRTNELLVRRISKHVLGFIRSGQLIDNLLVAQGSAIVEHLLNKCQCAVTYLHKTYSLCYADHTLNSSLKFWEQFVLSLDSLPCVNRINSCLVLK